MEWKKGEIYGRVIGGGGTKGKERGETRLSSELMKVNSNSSFFLSLFFLGFLFFVIDWTDGAYPRRRNIGAHFAVCVCVCACAFPSFFIVIFLGQ